MNAGKVIPLVGRIEFGPPAPPSPAVQHYTDQARLAWYDRIRASLEECVRVFGTNSCPHAEHDALRLANDILKEAPK